MKKLFLLLTVFVVISCQKKEEEKKEAFGRLLKIMDETEVIGIDEAQFFDPEITNVCEKLALSGARVFVAGLDMDYKAQPFGQMPNLLATADYITKLHAICMKCGNIAHVSFRKKANESQVLLGEKDTYEPRCRKCMHEK